MVEAEIKKKPADKQFKENVDKMVAEAKQVEEKKAVEGKVKKPDIEAPIVNGPAIIRHFLMAKNKRMQDPKAKKKVCIMGYAETSRMLAPFKDSEFEIWGLNELYQLIPRADKWFEIHCPGGQLHNSRRNPQHKKWLQSCKMPIYMTQKIPDIPASVAYPIKEITALFGKYFTNSISYMIALALYEGFPEMHVYGVDMALQKEYREQKPSCEWFLGMAAILCDKLAIPFESDLLKAHYLYGFQDSSPMARKFRDKIEELKSKERNAIGTLEEVKAGINKLQGAIQVTDYFLNNHTNPEK